MITVVSQPGNISLSRNEIILKLMAADSGGDVYAATGVRSEVRTTGFFEIPAGETLTVDYTEPDGATTSLTFTGALNPSTELEIPSDINQYINYTQYYQAVADKIAAHPQIGPYFHLYTVFNSGAGQSLWVESLEISNDWNVSFDITGLTNPNFAKYQYDTVVATTLPANHKILLDLFVEQTYLGGDFEEVVTLEGKIDTDGNVTFDLQDILHAEVLKAMGNLVPPAFDLNTPFIADNLRRYYYRYREDYDGITPVQWTTGALKYVMCGGVEQGYFAGNDFFNTLNNDNSLLTWYPSGKNVSADQPEFIAFYNHLGADKEVLIQYKYYTAESATPEIRFAYDLLNLTVKSGETLVLPVGFSQLGLSDTSIVKYTVQCVDKASPYDSGNPTFVSELRSFYVDHSYYLEKRYLLYYNSFCLPEVLRCVGYQTKDLRVERENGRKTLPAGYGVSDHELFQYDEEWSNPLTFRSGYLSKNEVDALQELLIYNKVFEVDADGYVRLHLIDNRYKVTETRQFLHTISFRAIASVYPVNYQSDFVASPLEFASEESDYPEVLGDDSGHILIDDTGAALGIQ